MKWNETIFFKKKEIFNFFYFVFLFSFFLFYLCFEI